MSTIDAKIIQHITNGGGSSTDVINMFSTMYSLTNSPPAEDVMEFNDCIELRYSACKELDGVSWILGSLGGSGHSYIKTGLNWIIRNIATNELERFVLICRDIDFNFDLDKLTADTPNHGIMVSLTSNKILPLWIGKSDKREIQAVIVIASDYEAYQFVDTPSETAGIFNVSQMSTSTLMKILSNYNADYNTFALLPE